MKDKPKDQPEHPEPPQPRPDAEPLDDGVPEGPGKNPPPPPPPENP